MSNPTELSDLYLDELETLCKNAPAMWYGTLQIADGVTDDNAALLIEACSPDTVAELVRLARRAQPEGEARQAEAFAWAVFAKNGNVIIWSKNRCEVEPVSKKYGRPVVPVIALAVVQHAESGTQELPLRTRFESWALGKGWREETIAKRDGDGYEDSWLDDYWDCWKDCAAQSQGAQPAELCIGFANNDQGVLVNVMQRHDDGTISVLHQGRVPSGDSFARFAFAAKAEAPAALDWPHAPGRDGSQDAPPNPVQQAAAPANTLLDSHINYTANVLGSAPGTPEAPARQPELAVWYGAMPESNGKSNFTAILKRKDAGPFDTCHITIDRPEYPDRVRYEADRVRWIIGEIEEEPFILDYDAEKHSGYGRAAQLDGGQGESHA